MTTTRYFGLDVHKRHVVVAAVDAQQQVILSPRKISVAQFPTWIQTELRLSDQIALEATANAWEIHDQLVTQVSFVAVANTHKIKLISASTRKTDKHDALVLAKLLAARLLPTIWVPPQSVRDLRRVTKHRSQLVGERTAAKNRLHALLHQHHIQPPAGDPFLSTHQEWWTTLPLTDVEQLQLRHDWLTIQHLNQLIQETETLIAQLSTSEEWSEPMTFLMQLPGVGLYTGMTILAAIGDIQRFPSAAQLVGYAGLGARVCESGDTRRTGKISKQGRRELRTALIISAWAAVRHSDYWQRIFLSLAQRIGKHKAITAVARKMVVVIWYILTKQEADRHADPQAVARCFMTWASTHSLARSQKTHRLDFVRHRLRLLGLLQRVHSFRANGRTHYLAVGT